MGGAKPGGQTRRSPWQPDQLTSATHNFSDRAAETCEACSL